MSFTQTALILLVFFWSLQVAASWVQWSHYRCALTAASASSDGFLGMGQHRPRFGLGAIALLEIAPDGRVRRLQTMSGWSVFSRFRSDDRVVGWTLAQLAAHCAPGHRDDRSARALRQAIAQVESVRARTAG